MNASRQEWRLAEAEHLLRLASLRLTALQEINSAKALVQAADQILLEQDDPAAFAARAELAKSLEALRSLQQPDRTGLFLQLGALREQVAQLNPHVPAFVDNGGVLASLAAEGDGSSRWAQWLERLSHYFRIDFSAAQDIRPVLSGQSLAQVRLALTLALQQAQWGALNGDGAVYQKSLQQREKLLGPQHPEVAEALVGLGWNAKQAGEAVERVAVTAPADAEIAAYLRLALRELRR